MYAIGVMVMPPDFQYQEVYFRGKPQHDRFDEFRVRHPSMASGRRAKIFAPFDALKGFGSAIASKNVRYEDKTELDSEAEAELNRRLSILKNLTYNSRMARMNKVRVTVCYFAPCTDENNDAYGSRGKYISLNGTCLKVDDEVSKSILVDSTRIAFSDIRSIDSNGDIFTRDWAEQCFPD